MAKSKSKWLIDAEDKLKEIYMLSANWDGYKSPKLPLALYQNALLFLSHIKDLDMPETFVCPVSGGGVQFEWHFEGRELEIEFIEIGIVGYLKDFGTEKTYGGNFSLTDPCDSQHIVNWLLKGADDGGT